jgi:hypothetical protein
LVKETIALIGFASTYQQMHDAAGAKGCWEPGGRQHFVAVSWYAAGPFVE